MTLIETIILNNNYHTDCVCPCNYLTPITRRRSFRGRLSIPVDARSGIRTHEANATDLKSVPFDRSGIRANVKIKLFLFSLLLFMFLCYISL